VATVVLKASFCGGNFLTAAGIRKAKKPTAALRAVKKESQKTAQRSEKFPQSQGFLFYHSTTYSESIK
jgi:hypothetical protein